MTRCVGTSTSRYQRPRSSGRGHLVLCRLINMGFNMLETGFIFCTSHVRNSESQGKVNFLMKLKSRNNHRTISCISFFFFFLGVNSVCVQFFH